MPSLQWMWCRLVLLMHLHQTHRQPGWIQPSNLYRDKHTPCTTGQYTVLTFSNHTEVIAFIAWLCSTQLASILEICSYVISTWIRRLQWLLSSVWLHTIIVSDGDGGITIGELNQFSFTGRVEDEVKALISLHNAIVSDENVHTVHSGLTINSNNTVIGGCIINSFCVKGKQNTNWMFSVLVRFWQWCWIFTYI